MFVVKIGTSILWYLLRFWAHFCSYTGYTSQNRRSYKLITEGLLGLHSCQVLCNTNQLFTQKNTTKHLKPAIKLYAISSQPKSYCSQTTIPLTFSYLKIPANLRHVLDSFVHPSKFHRESGSCTQWKNMGCSALPTQLRQGVSRIVIVGVWYKENGILEKGAKLIMPE